MQPTTASGPASGSTAIDSLIGVGGMGKVYRATADDGTPVALKIVKEDLARDETFRRRFRREARIAQTVRNPHVVPVRDTGEHDGLPYLAAQFIEGIDARPEARAGRSARSGHDRADLRAGRRRPPGAVGGGDGAPRRQARQHPARPATETAYITDFGLAKDSAGHRADPAGAAARIDGLHVAGADPRRAGDRRRRHLLARLRRVRMRVRTGRRSPTARACGCCGRTSRTSLRDPSADRTDIPPAFAQAMKAALRKEPAERPRTSVEYARSLSRGGGHPDRGRPAEP